MIGKTLGHYKILNQLGRGGMGEVYLAEDLSLDRKVALKFLPDAFTSDPESMARFEREAKLLASLNHPNIAGIYGLEQADGNRFLVLEYVEGETLQASLRKGALPLDEALELCRQIAEGLEAAHEKGVIHRDLKPANVMITAEEKVKILDFGLAKALSDETQSIDSSQSPTLTEAMTRPGVILGTAAYMSPEQAKGKSVDKRADIWAFGCILYECLTGKKAFEGETVTEALAAILRADPDWQLLPDSTPQNIRFVLRRCLSKDQKHRLRDVADILILIDEPVSGQLGADSVRYGFFRAPNIILIIICLAIGGGLSYLWHIINDSSKTLIQRTVSHIKPPPGLISAFHKGFALSPDGQTLVFSGRTVDGHRQLWKRPLADAHAVPIPGTENAVHPFWSPDGSQIAFFIPDGLQRIPAIGGQVITICTGIGTLLAHGTWGDNNIILFSTLHASGRSIFRVDADGGEPLQVSGLDGEAVISPHWLPGGRTFLYCNIEEDYSGRIYAASIDGSHESIQVMNTEAILFAEPAFFVSPTGHIFFNRGGSLYIQQFDMKSLSPVNRAVAIAGPVGSPLNWFALSAASDKAVMLAREDPDDIGNPGDPISSLKWINRQGDPVGTLGPPQRYWTQRLSPDGLRAAVNPEMNIWVVDAENPRVKVTSRVDHAYSPVWSPDGEKIAFASGISEQKVLLQPAKQGGQVTELLNKVDVPMAPVDWSPDGRYLFLVNQATDKFQSQDIWVYDFEKESIDSWLDSKFNECQARFSRDGRMWVAYSSDANGLLEVWIRPFNKDEGDAVLVSPNGGRHPTWREDGLELFYLGPDNELLAASLTWSGSIPEVVQTHSLFKVFMNDIGIDVSSPYDAASDGQQFLVNIPEAPESLLFIQGLEELLQRGQ